MSHRNELNPKCRHDVCVFLTIHPHTHIYCSDVYLGTATGLTFSFIIWKKRVSAVNLHLVKMVYSSMRLGHLNERNEGRLSLYFVVLKKYFKS